MYMCLVCLPGYVRGEPLNLILGIIHWHFELLIMHYDMVGQAVNASYTGMRL